MYMSVLQSSAAACTCMIPYAFACRWPASPAAPTFHKMEIPNKGI